MRLQSRRPGFILKTCRPRAPPSFPSAHGRSAPRRLVYVTCSDADNVTVIDANSLTIVGSPFRVGPRPLVAALDERVGRHASATLAARTGAVVERFPVGRSPSAVALSPDGRYAYVTSIDDGGVSVVDTHTTIPVGSRPTAIVFSPTRRLFYVAQPDAGTVTAVDTASNTVTGAPIPVGGQPGALALTPDEKRLYVADSAAGTVRAVDMAGPTSAVGPPVQVGGAPMGLAVVPDGTRVYVADSAGGTLAVIDTATGTMTGAPVALATGAFDVASARDSRRLYVADAGADAILVVDATTLTVTARVALPSTPRWLAVTPDGSRLLVTLPSVGSLAGRHRRSRPPGGPDPGRERAAWGRRLRRRTPRVGHQHRLQLPDGS